MRFTEFYNRNKNVIKEVTRKKIASAIPISEDRDAFYNGETFKRDDIVESNGVQYRVLEKCSNYFQVMDATGQLFRKFPKDLILTESTEFPKVSDITGVEESEDPVGQLKERNMYTHKTQTESVEYQAKDKLTIAKMIADAVGISYDVVSSPDNLVNQAVRKASKDPALLKNKAIIQNMLSIADSVGIKVTKSVFDKEVSESRSHEEIAAAEYHRYADAVKKGDNFKAQDLKTKIEFHRKKLQKKFVKEDALEEAHKINDRVKIIKGPKDLIGKEGHIGEIRHGLHDKSPKTYTIFHGESGAIQLSKEQFRKVNEDAKPYATVSSKGKKLVSAFDVISHAKKLAGGKKVTNDHVKQAREELMREGFEIAPMTLKDLRMQIAEASAENVDQNPQMDPIPSPEVDAAPAELPHGHQINGNRSDTHRRMIIKKLKGD